MGLSGSVIGVLAQNHALHILRLGQAYRAENILLGRVDRPRLPQALDLLRQSRRFLYRFRRQKVPPRADFFPDGFQFLTHTVLSFRPLSACWLICLPALYGLLKG